VASLATTLARAVATTAQNRICNKSIKLASFAATSGSWGKDVAYWDDRIQPVLLCRQIKRWLPMLHYSAMANLG